MTARPFPERPAPDEWRLLAPDGTERTVHLERLTLVAAVKADCDGCRPFYRDDLSALAPLEVLVVAAASATEFNDGAREVFVAPELLAALGVRWPPLCVLVAPSPPRVVAEVVPFGVPHVAEELRRLGWL